MRPATTDQNPCPNCGSKDLVSIQLASTDGELLECQSCKRVCEVKYEADGSTRLVPV